MKIRKLILENFGPFKSYQISFPKEEHCCVLLTGKNNEGKSNIILALKLVAAAMRSVNKSQLRIVINNGVYYKLPQIDVESINIGRTLYNYAGGFAYISAEFDDNILIEVTLDEKNDLIYTDSCSRITNTQREAIGFIPPLGPLAETEELLTPKHITKHINSSLAPRHLRNHLKQVLNDEEVKLVQVLINTSWPSLEMLQGEYNIANNTLSYFFKENGIHREFAWAGQGLQVWFQIITHLVRLRYSSILVLDEPEINMHPEKQNDLIKILDDFFHGDVIIATHSMELMNNVNVSHILHIQKSKKSPKVKSSKDKTALELIRSKIGSSFNLIASQFETCEMLFFTEDTSDDKLIRSFAKAKRIRVQSFNIPLHGFSEYPKAKYYKDAYKLLIGKNVRNVVLLDRDYYPEEYLEKVKLELKKSNIETFFTPGKEIENIFIHPAILQKIIKKEDRNEFNQYWDKFYESEFSESHGSFLTLYQQFLNPKLNIKTIIKKYMPDFIKEWKNEKKRHLLISGKHALKSLRQYYSKKYKKSLTNAFLKNTILELNLGEIENLLLKIFNK